MANLTYAQVQERHGQNAEAVWNEICEIGGYGTLSPTYSGGLDIAGALSDKNKFLSSEVKARIAELSGMGSAAESEVDRLVKMARGDLERIAKDAGLDGNSYTNKRELAQAIVNKQKEGN